MHDITARIWAEAQKTRDDIISGLRDFIAAGEGGEDGIQDLFCRKAEALGCEIASSSYHPTDVVLVEEFAGSAAIDPQERISVVAHAKAGGKGRSLILFAHPDCEKFIDGQGWAHDPFKGEIIDGKLYGWGVADDLSGIAAGLQAIALLHALRIRPAADVYVASTPSKRHARGVSHLLQNGLQANAAVYLHPAESGVGLQEIKGFTSGQIEFRIEIEGLAPPTTEPHQTAFAHKGINAIDKAYLIWEALKRLDAERSATVRHPALDAEIGRSTNLMVSHIDAGSASRLTRGADRCILGAALSFPPTETLESVRLAIETAVAQAAAKDAWLSLHPPKLIWDSGVAGAETVSEHDLVTAAMAAIQSVSGVRPWINPMHTGSDIRNPIVQKAIPTIGLGPRCGNLAQNGALDEWVDADDHVRFVAATAIIIATWCGLEPIPAAV
ncbi:MAG: M20/M25/M40 family metallo-hydrolase [Rhizobium rhizophilum]|uniref:M20/M25/M40 family metallo-hydrolase n=1 Tax=Rhizobium rhizophilum TaxID=1850373 RepID=UPI00391DDAF4